MIEHKKILATGMKFTAAAALCALLASGAGSAAPQAERSIRVGVYTPYKSFGDSAPGREFLERRGELQAEMRSTRQTKNEQLQQKRRDLRDEMAELRREQPEGWREQVQQLNEEVRITQDQYNTQIQQAVKQMQSETAKLQQQARDAYQRVLQQTLTQLAEQKNLPLIVEEDHIAFRADSVELVYLDDALAQQLRVSAETATNP